MNLYKDSYENTQTAMLTDNENRIIEEVKEDIFNANVGDELSMIEDLIQEWLPDAEGTIIEEFLKSLWNYFYAIRLIGEERSYSKVSSLIEEAANGFRKTGQQELANLSEALKAYTEAIIELRKLDVHKALELFNGTTWYLQQAGLYSNHSRPLMDHMKTDALFSAVIQASQTPDISLAEILTKQASTASQNAAEHHYETGTLEHSTHQGLTHFYKVILALNLAFRDLNNFKYEKLAGNKELAEETRQALDLLKKGDLEDVNIRNCIHICEAFVEISEVITELSSLILSALKSTANADPDTMQKLKDKVHSAISSASQAGPQGAMYVKLCEDLHKKIRNFELFARQNEKNLILYSSLRVTALFFPLFVVAFWANSTFNANKSILTLFSFSLVVALIAGFGYGAIKFKRIFGFGPITKNKAAEKSGEQAEAVDT